MRTTAALMIALAACTKPAPKPCAVDASKVPSRPQWSGRWNAQSLDEPPNGWIGAFALSPDGTQALYANSLAGDFIPTSDGVSLMRIDLADRVDRHPAIVELPGEALRNYAAIRWSESGVVWASWSAFGIADPWTPSVKVLEKIPKTGKDRPTFPLYSSAVASPGGACLAVILDAADKRILQSWNSTPASAPAHQQPVEERESLVAWETAGVLLLKAPPIVSSTSATIAASSARWLDPASGKTSPERAPPARAQASVWIGDGWLFVDAVGEVSWIPRETAKDGEALPIAHVKPSLEPNEKLKQHHRWLRIFAADNGEAIAVEEAVIGPRSDKRAMHLLLRAWGS